MLPELQNGHGPGQESSQVPSVPPVILDLSAEAETLYELIPEARLFAPSAKTHPGRSLTLLDLLRGPIGPRGRLYSFKETSLEKGWLFLQLRRALVKGHLKLPKHTPFDLALPILPRDVRQALLSAGLRALSEVAVWEPAGVSKASRRILKEALAEVGAIPVSSLLQEAPKNQAQGDSAPLDAEILNQLLRRGINPEGLLVEELPGLLPVLERIRLHNRGCLRVRQLLCLLYQDPAYMAGKVYRLCRADKHRPPPWVVWLVSLLSLAALPSHLGQSQVEAASFQVNQRIRAGSTPLSALLDEALATLAQGTDPRTFDVLLTTFGLQARQPTGSSDSRRQAIARAAAVLTPLRTIAKDICREPLLQLEQSGGILHQQTELAKVLFALFVAGTRLHKLSAHFACVLPPVKSRALRSRVRKALVQVGGHKISESNIEQALAEEGIVLSGDDLRAFASEVLHLRKQRDGYSVLPSPPAEPKGSAVSSAVSRVLYEQARPLAVEHLVTLCKERHQMSEAEVVLTLRTATFALKLAKGRYLHTERLRLGPSELATLVDSALVHLPEDGTPRPAGYLFDLLRFSDPRLHLCRKGEEQHRAFLYILRADPRLRVELPSLLVGRAAKRTKGHPLGEWLLLELLSQVPKCSREMVHFTLQQRYGYTIKGTWLHSWSRRAMEKGLVVVEREHKTLWFSLRKSNSNKAGHQLSSPTLPSG